MSIFSLADVTDSPPVLAVNEITSTELPIDVLEPHMVESVIITSSIAPSTNQTVEPATSTSRHDVSKGINF